MTTWGLPAYDDRLSIDDGSESTLGQSGKYTGDWDFDKNVPHGTGVMAWDNGITYQGRWAEGVYHGYGSKLYSRGGGYEGDWVEGRRQGRGAHIFAGKFGYDRWEGPFVDDQPHGMGTMKYPDGSQADFEFMNGKPSQVAAEGQFSGHLEGLEDGSPSTAGEAGIYKGAWCDKLKKPNGFGVMKWYNGIEYKVPNSL